MSDFLARLAERTLGQTPRVQPLLASRFAPASPPPDSPAASDESHAGETASEPYLSGRNSERSSSDASVDTSLQASPAPGESPRLREDSEGTPAAQEGGRFVAPVPTESTPAANTDAHGQSELTSRRLGASLMQEPTPALERVPTRDTSTVEAIGDFPFTAGQSPARSPLPGGEHAQEGAPPAMDSRLPLAATVGLPHASAARDMVIERNELDTAESVSARQITAPEPQRLGPVDNSSQVAVRSANHGGRRGAERLLPPSAMSASQTPPIPQAEAAPVIRVTIGRIEVRAVMPPAPATKPTTPSRASSILSLDDYLKRGHGERP